MNIDVVIFKMILVVQECFMVFYNVEHCMCDIGGNVQCPHGIFQNLNTSIIGNCVWILIRTKGKPFGLHMQLAKMRVNMWVGEIDTIVPMKIPFRSRRQV
jgi:hypothetical protein